MTSIAVPSLALQPAAPASPAGPNTSDTAVAATDLAQASAQGAALLRSMASSRQPVVELEPAGNPAPQAGDSISEQFRDAAQAPNAVLRFDNLTTRTTMVPTGGPALDTTGPIRTGPHPIDPRPQRPDAPQAAEILERDFDTFLHADQGGAPDRPGDPTKINNADLRAVAENATGRFSKEQQDVAQLLLDSPATLAFFERAADDLFVGGITRESVQAARQSLEDGSYVGRMLDHGMNPLITTKELNTGANGEVLQPRHIGRMHIGKEGLEEIVKDPGVPQNVKNTAVLLLWENDGSANLSYATRFTAEHADAASAVVESSGWGVLGRDQKNIVAQAFRSSQGDPGLMRGIQSALEQPGFQRASSAEQSTFLNMLTRFHDAPSAAGSVSTIGESVSARGVAFSGPLSPGAIEWAYLK